MPYIIVKLWPGKSEQHKTQLAEAITKDVTGKDKVYKPDIEEQSKRLYKKPGYTM